MERLYRKRIKAPGLVSFQLSIKETDLWIGADRILEKEARDLILGYRQQIESYIGMHPEFLTTLHPYPEDPFASSIIRDMIDATRDIGVGPMAAVAGAIAQRVGEGLLKHSDQVIVENGGDIYVKMKRPVTVSVFAGKSPLSDKIGLKVPVRRMPLGICSSSGTVGHSLSKGKADAVCLLSTSAARADGAATALCNRVKNRKELERLPEWAEQVAGIDGGLAIMGEVSVTWGDVELQIL